MKTVDKVKYNIPDEFQTQLCWICDRLTTVRDTKKVDGIKRHLCRRCSTMMSWIGKLDHPALL